MASLLSWLQGGLLVLRRSSDGVGVSSHSVERGELPIGHGHLVHVGGLGLGVEVGVRVGVGVRVRVRVRVGVGVGVRIQVRVGC